MAQFTHRFEIARHYGLGSMMYRMEESFFLMRGQAPLAGAFGRAGPHLLHAPSSGALVVISFGDDACLPTSFQFLIQAGMVLR